MKEELLLLRNQLKMGHRISFAEAMLLQRAIDILVNKAGNSPAIPDGSEHCPCCGKKLRRACSVEGCDGNHVAHGLCQKHYDMKRWEDPEQVERFREAGRRYRGKKKTTVATPQEPKP
ncbi:hypothetical protein [Klebsiella pneumoniae]|uniref:hypothetical protein n=1 Tax=Klebsiella pneumoniae TaxID=573 RepID=UPI000A206FF7|nr:hypothetical protein [Klebsiella pneumoniae]ARN27722.1 hypothetical protein A4U70_19530 [Klebsiella pneumoniae]